MRCPNCKNHVLQKSGNRIRLRTKGQIVFEDGACQAQCFWCKSPVTIPLEIQEGATILSERFYLQKD